MARVRLTEARVASIIAKAEADAKEWQRRRKEAQARGAKCDPGAYNVIDAVTDGLILRVQRLTGHCSYMHRFKAPGGRRPVRRLVAHCKKSDLETARRIVRENWETLRTGRDPAEVLREAKAKAQLARDNTLRVVAADWLREYARNPIKPLRQADEFERLINHDLLPTLGGKAVAEIDQEDITAWAKSIRDRGAFYVAFSAYSALRSILGWAVAQKSYGLQFSPCDFPVKIEITKVLGARRQKRRRHLNTAELRAYVLGARALPTPWREYFLLLLYTGQRRDEVAQCVWSEFDLDSDPPTWFIGAARYKTDVDVLHPLARQTAALLRGLPRYKSGQHCLTTSWGKKGLGGFSRAKRLLEAKMLAILREDNPEGELPAFWVHDLRRNLKGGMTDLGIPDDHSEACLGHVPAGIKGHYQVSLFFEQKAKAFQKWADHVDAIAEGKVGKVLPMKRRAAQ
jgi:integrase